MRAIARSLDLPLIVGLIALAVVLFHICTTDAQEPAGCPEVISTQEACYINLSEHEDAGVVEISANIGYDSWRLNLPRVALRYDSDLTTSGNRDRVALTNANTWLTPRDGDGRCHADPNQAHCTTPADWDGETTINWSREASNFFVSWYRDEADRLNENALLSKTYFICDNHDCGEPEPEQRTAPTRHRDEVEPQTTQPAPVTTPSVKVNEPAPQPTVSYTQVANPDYAALIQKLEQLRRELAALDAQIAATPKTITVTVEEAVDEPASTVTAEPEEVHLWVWTESDLDMTGNKPYKILPERIQAWRNSGSTEQCFDQSYLQHFDQKYSVHQHPCKD